MPAETDTRRWQRRREARPGEILGAAMDLFVEKGFAATRMEEIAQRAGITKGTLYLYYESKEALFRAAVRETILPNLLEGERLVAEWTGTTVALLREFVRVWWARVGESRTAYAGKLVTSEAANFPELAKFYVDAVTHRSRRLFEAVIQRGIDRGEFRTDLDLRHAARVMMAPLLNAALYKHSLERFDDEPLDYTLYFDYHIDFLLRALARRTDKYGADA